MARYKFLYCIVLYCNKIIIKREDFSTAAHTSCPERLVLHSKLNSGLRNLVTGEDGLEPATPVEMISPLNMYRQGRNRVQGQTKNQVWRAWFLLLGPSCLEQSSVSELDDISDTVKNDSKV